jgi:membrane-associated phospholipid phosphatase
LFCATYAFLVLTELGQRIENLGLAGATLRADSERDGSLANLSQISIVSFGAAALIVLGAAVLTRRPRLGAVVVTVMVGSTAIAELLKAMLPRPELFAAPAWLLRNTFPSGHATVAAAMGAAALLVVPGRVRWLALPLAAAYVAIIGQATQVVGWHRLSGAIGGVLLVLAIAALALAVQAMRGLVVESAHGRIGRRVEAVMIGLAVLTLLVGALVATLPIVFPLLQAPVGASGAFAHTALDLFGIGTTMVAFVAFGALIEPYEFIDARPVKPVEAPPGSGSS